MLSLGTYDDHDQMMEMDTSCEPTAVSLVYNTIFWVR